MFIPDDEKDDRKAALQKLMGLMGKATGDKLGALKGKPVAASITMEKVAPHEEPMDDDSMGPDADDAMDDHDGDEPSPEEKMMIEKLYHKFCM